MSAASDGEPQLMTAEEVAVLLGKGVRRVQQIAVDLGAQRVGGRLWFDRARVDAYRTAGIDPDDGRWISVTDAAEMLECSPSRVQQRAKGLGGKRVGDAWLFDRDRVRGAGVELMVKDEVARQTGDLVQIQRGLIAAEVARQLAVLAREADEATALYGDQP